MIKKLRPDGMPDEVLLEKILKEMSISVDWPKGGNKDYLIVTCSYSAEEVNIISENKLWLGMRDEIAQHFFRTIKNIEDKDKPPTVCHNDEKYKISLWQRVRGIFCST